MLSPPFHHHQHHHHHHTILVKRRKSFYTDHQQTPMPISKIHHYPINMTATPPPGKISRSRHMQHGIKKRSKSPGHSSVTRNNNSSAALDEYTRSMQHYLETTDFKLGAESSSREGSPDRDSEDEDVRGMADSFNQLDVDHTQDPHHHQPTRLMMAPSLSRVPLQEDRREARRSSVLSSSSVTSAPAMHPPLGNSNYYGAQPSAPLQHQRRSSQYDISSTSSGGGRGEKKYSSGGRVPSSGDSSSSISSNKY